MTLPPVLRVRQAVPQPWLLERVGSTTVARVLAARGVVEPAQLESSLTGLLDPTLLDGVHAAAELIADWIARDGVIVVIGDYDADGATSTALAVSGLRALGAKHVQFLVPDRIKDGYGLGEAVVERAIAMGAQLLITVDNGTSSIAGVARARAVNVDVLVTDHHLPSTALPQANVIVNPNILGNLFPSKSLCGVGVMFYVLLALRALLRDRSCFNAERPAPNLADWLDLVALGTVADVVPLDTNNRILVHQGLQRMRAGRARPGLQALIQIARRQAPGLNENDLAFALAPRLNAAGRLADMTIGVRCLLAESASEAQALAQALDGINVERRALSESMTQHALGLLEDALQAQPRAVCLFAEQWHEGVIGIVAGRVREVANLPAFAFAVAQDGDTGQAVLKGSGRSIAGVNLRDVLYDIDRTHPGLLLRFGGHAMAAGVTLTLARLRPFQAALDAAVRALQGAVVADQGIEFDGSLDDEALTLGTAHVLERYGPWGSGFPQARFSDEFVVVHVRALTQKFFRLVLRRGERLLEATCNSPAPDVGARCGLLYGLNVNRYRDNETLQLQIERWWHVASV